MPSTDPPSTDPDPRPGGRSRDELLGRVKRRGRQLRQRHRATRAIGAVAVVAVVAVVALAIPQLAESTDDQQVTAASTATTSAEVTDETTTVPGPTTTSKTGTGTGTTTTVHTGTADTPPSAPTTSVAPTTTAPPPAEPSCRDSYDAACGPYFWDPAPEPNQPLTVEVSFTPAQPQPGDEVTFQVTVTDPDARIERECNIAVAYGDGDGPDGCASSPSCLARYGPWTPPERTADRYETTFTHRYEDVGDFTAVFAFQSRSDACYDDPYGSDGEGQVRVPVRSGG